MRRPDAQQKAMSSKRILFVRLFVQAGRFGDEYLETTEQAYPTNTIHSSDNCISTLFSTEQEQLSFIDACDERD